MLISPPPLHTCSTGQRGLTVAGVGSQGLEAEEALHLDAQQGHKAHLALHLRRLARRGGAHGLALAGRLERVVVVRQGLVEVAVLRVRDGPLERLVERRVAWCTGDTRHEGSGERNLAWGTMKLSLLTPAGSTYPVGDFPLPVATAALMAPFSEKPRLMSCRTSPSSARTPTGDVTSRPLPLAGVSCRASNRGYEKAPQAVLSSKLDHSGTAALTRRFMPNG